MKTKKVNKWNIRDEKIVNFSGDVYTIDVNIKINEDIGYYWKGVFCLSLSLSRKKETFEEYGEK